MTDHTTDQRWGPRPRRLMAALTAVVVGALGSLLTAPAAQASTSTARCASVVVIVVRGTGEAVGSGTYTGGRLYSTGGQGRAYLSASKVQNGTSVSVRRNGLIYPANALPSWDAGAYPWSVGEGERALRAEIDAHVAACSTSSRLVLVGYSQGAHVIGDVLDKRGTQLSSAANSRIKAVVLFGDPTFRAGEPWNASGSGTRNGIFARPQGDLGNYSSRIRSFCFANDRFCQNSNASNADAVHASYGADATQARGANFILGKL